MQMGSVAVPGGELVYNMLEPVAVVVPNDELNVMMPDNEVQTCTLIRKITFRMISLS